MNKCHFQRAACCGCLVLIAIFNFFFFFSPRRGQATSHLPHGPECYCIFRSRKRRSRASFLFFSATRGQPTPSRVRSSRVVILKSQVLRGKKSLSSRRRSFQLSSTFFVLLFDKKSCRVFFSPSFSRPKYEFDPFSSHHFF